MTKIHLKYPEKSLKISANTSFYNLSHILIPFFQFQIANLTYNTGEFFTP